MSDNSLKKQAFSGVFWKFAERICAQLVSTVVSIILARILMPDDYSVVSIVTIFFTFCNLFISGGFNTALIQKKDADILDYSTILFVSLGVSTVMYAVMFFAAPYIAVLYHIDLLIPVIRVMSLSFFINAVKGVVIAKTSSELDFRKFFLATIVGTLISAAVGIVMAVKGFGAWALVAQNMTNSFIDTVLLIIATKVKFIFAFSRERFVPLFKYSYKLFLASLISAIYEDIRPLIVGLKFSSVDLAYYNKGKQYPTLINSTVTDTLQAVLFPVMSKVQDDKTQIVSMTRRFIRVCSYVIFPVMLGLFATARNFTVILLTEKWLDIVIYIQIFCISHMFNIVQIGNLQPIRAVGRSDVYLMLDVIKKSCYAIVIIVFVIFTDSPQLLAVTSFIHVMIASIVNTTANRKLFDYKRTEQIWDILQNLLPAAIMCVCVLSMNQFSINIYLLFALQIVVGVVIYILLSILFRNSSFYYLLDFLKRLRKSDSKNVRINDKT